MKKQIKKATKALQKNILVAQANPYRPQYHFCPPANWMNDPNGTIFHNGQYHLFYQHNPYRPRWGRMHWGHARSKDLIHWEHLPIALAPGPGWKEMHCFSGCCVIAPDGTPTIFYTSISPLSFATAVRQYAQQWAARGDPALLTWEKFAGNPILDSNTHHPGNELRNWRDPYMWRENDIWYMVIAGQFKGEHTGSVLLYQSTDLKDWHYTGRLYQGNERQGKTWECPNYFPLGDRHILVISPFDKVMYAIGEFTGKEHLAEAWHVFDHGKCFYATNTFIEEDGRTVLVGWIKVDGKDGWAGCLSLPRELKLDEARQLRIAPIVELQNLRHKHRHLERVLDVEGELAGAAPYFGECVEISAKFDLSTAESVGFTLSDDKNDKAITYDYTNHTLTALDESAQIQFPRAEGQLELHIFIDKSVVEIFINGRETFTTTFYPQLQGFNALKIAPFFKKARGSLEIDFWTLEGVDL